MGFRIDTWEAGLSVEAGHSSRDLQNKSMTRRELVRARTQRGE